MSKLSELLSRLRNASTKEYETILEEISKAIFEKDFADELEKADLSEIVELMIEIKADVFERFLETYENILKKKIANATPEIFGRLFEGLSKEKRKMLSRRLRSDISRRLSQFSIKDIVKMIYSVVPAAREIVLSQYKEIMMRPDFQRIILEDLEGFAEFLSVLPESLRRTLINKHKSFFLSDEFVSALKQVDSDVRANIFRWLPADLARELVERVKK